MACIDTANILTMLAGVVYDEVACGTGVEVVGPLSSSTLVCGGLFFVAATMVVVGGTSGGVTKVNISSIGTGWCIARWIAIKFSSGLIRLASKVRWTFISESSWC